jgi:hypothetical protein
MVAILLIPIRNHNIPKKWLDNQREIQRAVLNEVLQRALRLLTFKHNPSTKSGHCNVHCEDGNFRRFKPVSVASLAHSTGDRDRYHLERHVCFRCEYPKNQLGDYVPLHKRHLWRDYNLYRTLRDANTRAANAVLSLRHVH